MIMLQHPQGSPEWLAARAGIPTASELGQLLTETGAIRKGEMPRTYMARKLAERWLGHPLQSFSGGDMEQGTIREDEARPWAELAWGMDIEEVGLLTTDDGSFGASPDGMLADGRGVEIKCPAPHTHCKWLMNGGLPDEHALQVQGGLYVTGAKAWRFVSYCRGFPQLVVDVGPDAKFQDAIGTIIPAFVAELNGHYAAMVARNGGREPVRATPRVTVTPPEHSPF